MPMPGKRTNAPGMPRNPETLGLPARPFLWTLDQVSVIISVPERQLIQTYMYLEGRSIGIAHRNQLLARNIADPDDKPDWRIAERELIRWMKFKGFRWYDRGSLLY